MVEAPQPQVYACTECCAISTPCALALCTKMELLVGEEARVAPPPPLSCLHAAAHSNHALYPRPTMSLNDDDVTPPSSSWDLVDVFCGGGLYSFGARAAGMNIIAAVDNSADALSVYKNNFCSVQAACAEVGPGLADFAFPEPRERLHLHFSPPCQELSNAKRRARAARVWGLGAGGAPWAAR